MCTLSRNAKRILVKLTVGVTTGCHLTWKTTPENLHLQPWVFRRLIRDLSGIFIKICSSSRDNVIDEHLVFVLLKCVLSLNYIPPHTVYASLMYLFHMIRKYRKCDNFED